MNFIELVGELRSTQLSCELNNAEVLEYEVGKIRVKTGTIEICQRAVTIIKIRVSDETSCFVEEINPKFSDLNLLQQAAIKSVVDKFTQPMLGGLCLQEVFHLRFVGDIPENDSYLNITPTRKVFSTKIECQTYKTKFTQQEISTMDLTGLTTEFAGWSIKNSTAHTSTNQFPHYGEYK